MTKPDTEKVNSILDSLIKLERYNSINLACKLVLHEAEHEHDQNIKARLFEVYQSLEALHDQA